MIGFNQLELRRGQRVIMRDASFSIFEGQKVGLTGANGAGKSSLFALIQGKLEAENGELQISSSVRMAHVAQETPASASSALDYVIDGDVQLRQLQRELEQAELSADGILIAELHSRLQAVDGYTAEARAARLLNGLGFAPGQESRPVSSFSGGWRMRLNLAQALMCPSDLLMLDEPTNHLDLDAVFWLQDWLKRYPGTLLLISHDREFLDELTDVIIHIEHQQVYQYTGNYSAFEHYRAERLAQQQAAHEKQTREVQHIQSFIDRFRAKATKAKQAQSRIKALEKIELIASAHVDSPFHFEFQPPEKNPDLLVSLGKVSLGYGDEPIVDGVRMTLMRGDRVALIGPNGAGKSTLIKYLAGELAASAGQRSDAEHLRIGYFAQHQLEQLNPDESPLEHLQRLDRNATEKALRNFLGGFGFSGDSALDPVAPFSGGEKARVVLALLVYQRPNLLLLDEPTNHLDLEMRHALTMALQDFSGAVVVVSHDRHLLRTVADRLLLVAGGRVADFDGDLDDYRSWLMEFARTQQKDTASQSGSVLAGEEADESNRKAQRQREADLRKQLKPLRDKAAKLEKQMEKLHVRQQELELLLADNSLYDPESKDRLVTLLREKSELDQSIADAEEAWLEAQSALEASC